MSVAETGSSDPSPTPHVTSIFLLFERLRSAGLMPVAQSQPLQKHDNEKEHEPQHSCRKHQREQVACLHLVAGVYDRVAQAALSHARRARKELACDAANHADEGRDAYTCE